MKLLFSVILLLFLPALSFGQEKTIDIFVQQTLHEDYKKSFYMWIGDSTASIGVPPKDVEVGFSFGGVVYLSSEDIGHAMFFVKKTDNNNVEISFGGLRPNDIIISLPKNTKGNIQISTIDKSK